LYLVGGTTLVYEGLREQSLDIDIAYEVEDRYEAEFAHAIRTLKDELQINVEQASPGDFIPLPAGWKDRAKFVGRFGQVDVYHFDLYSTSLSKIERGREGDYQDVLALLRAELCRFEAAHPHDEPHYYLSLFATRPESRGRGIGMALLREDLAAYDAEGVPTYLESSNPANDARYAAVGYRAVGRFEHSSTGAPVTTMWRPVGG